MYLVVIGWLYVALMMGVAEATNASGTVLGGVITFVLYGLLPAALVAYLLGAPSRRKAIRRQEAQEWAAQSAGAAAPPSAPAEASLKPDESALPAAGTQAHAVAPVREKP